MLFRSGNIAGVMANTIAKMDGVHVQAIASRDKEKAKKFAEEFQIAEWYGTYEELLQQENIELVYIATPHSHHAEHMELCIAYKKTILCEKAFTATAAQAREELEYAKEQKVFVAEAIWTRYMPSRNIIKETMESGIIGEIHSLTANLGYSIDHVERMQEPSLAGGALLDLGVYPINFAVMCFGEETESKIGRAHV